MSDKFDIKKAIGNKFEPYEMQVTSKDVILYALGIGFQKDPMNKEHYDFTYENAEDFKAFPTIAVVIGHRTFGNLSSIPGIPAFNPMMLLHGEEKVEVYGAIDVDSTVVVQESLFDLQDKKKAFVMVIETVIKDKETGDLKAKIYTNLFVRAPGGFGHKGSYKNPIPEAPKR